MMSIPEIEITQKLNLTEQENTLVVMHSIKNVTNILKGELYFLGILLKDREALKPSIKIVNSIIDAMDDSKGIMQYMNKIQEIESAILKNINEVLIWHPGEKENDKVNLILNNIKSIFKIIVIRAIEILSIMEYPERWETFSIDELNIDFINFFTAIEKNSKGRYRIVYNLAQQNADDYFFNLSINSIDSKTVYMPPIFKDVMRDLMANARKYTNPGGVILSGFFYDEKSSASL